MQLQICAVGAMKNAPEKALIDKYLKLLPWPVDIREIIVDSKLPTIKRVAAETEKLRAALSGKSRSTIIALDSRGQMVTSEKFAACVQKSAQLHHGKLSFLIGGADGLDASLLKQADHVIALGACTWPHLLARALLLEQLYRAYTIHTHHPYHSGH